MPDRFIASRIRDLPLFERLTDAQIDQISDAFQAIRYEPGMIVFRQEQASQGLMLIVDGRGVFMRYTPQGVEQPIGQIAAGEFINESALFNEQFESASLRAVETMIVLLLSRGRFAQFLSGKPEIRANLRVPPEWGGSTPNSASQPPGITPAPQQPPAMPSFSQPNLNAGFFPPAQVLQAPHTPPAQTAFAANQIHQPSPVQPTAAASTGMRTSPQRLFKGQRDDEIVLNIFKRHWWAFVRYAWIALVIVIIAFVVAAGVASSSALLAVALIGGGLVVGGVIMAYFYFEWRDDMAVVTDQRVVRIWNNLLRLENSIADLPLDRILEVNSEIPPGDPMARLFNYGTVIVKTAGQGGSIEVDMIPKPTGLQTAIFAQRDRYRDSSVARQRAQVQADIQHAIGGAPNTAQASSPANLGGMMDPQLRTSRGFFLARTRFVNEDGDVVYRKHFTVWLGIILIPLLVVLAGIVIVIVSFTVQETILRGGIGLSIGGLVFVFGCLWVYIADWDWRNDMFIVGDQTVTIIHKRPFWLQNKIEQIRMAQIDNVFSDVSGFIDTLLNRGVVKVFLIGADEKSGKVLGPLFDPQELGGELSRRQQSIKAQRERDDANQNRQAITEYISQYHQIINQPPTQAQSAPPPPAHAPSSPPPIAPRDGIRPPNIPRARRDSELE